MAGLLDEQIDHGLAAVMLILILLFTLVSTASANELYLANPELDAGVGRTYRLAGGVC